MPNPIDPKLLERIRNVLVMALDHLEDQSYPVPGYRNRLVKDATLVARATTVAVLERILTKEDSGPDHAAYLVDTVAGYGAWENTGRIQAVLTTIRAKPWQRAFALAKTYDPNLHL